MKTITLLLTIITIAFFTQTKGQSIEVSGEVNSPSTWSDTVFLVNDITITAELKIKAGTKVLAKGYFGIFVENEGSIIAEGSQTDSIFFTPSDTTGFTTRGSITDGAWNGIKFRSSIKSSFRYCKFSFGKAVGSNPDYSGGAISTYHISNSSNLDLSFHHCVFKDNCASQNGGALCLRYNCSAIIDNCSFINNKADSGGAVSSWGTYGTQTHNSKFIRNTSTFGAALHLMFSKETDYVTNSYITQNENDNYFSGTIYIHGESPIIVNTQIIDNSGCGISAHNSELKLINCNIIGSARSAIFINKATPYLYNSIIWDNQIENYYPNESAPFAYNCNIEGGNNFDAYVYENCIESDPLFVNSVVEDHTLSSSSPCINAGDTLNISTYLPNVDLFGNSRIWNNKIDIGAYEYISDSELNKSIALTENLDFGTVKIDTFKSLALVVKNNGNSSYNVSGAEMPDNYSMNFSNILLHPNDSINLDVTFTPTSAQEYNGIITINGGFTSGKNTVEISGIGGESIIRLPDHIRFDSTRINTTIVDTLTINNDGNLALNITNIELPDGFSADWENGTILAENSQKVAITFSPILEQEYTGIITVNGDFTNGINTANLYGKGTGIPTGIKKVVEQNIEIYPNPFSQTIRINSENIINQIVFINIDGKECLKVDSPLKEINTSKLPSGLYFLKIEVNDEIIIKKLIKK